MRDNMDFVTKNFATAFMSAMERDEAVPDALIASDVAAVPNEICADAGAAAFGAELLEEPGAGMTANRGGVRGRKIDRNEWGRRGCVRDGRRRVGLDGDEPVVRAAVGELDGEDRRESAGLRGL